MEVILTAIVAIVLLVAGLIALSYFYSVTHSVIDTIKTRLFIYSLENLLAGISTRLPQSLKCDLAKLTITVSINGKIIVKYDIPNVIVEAYWPNPKCKAPPLNPWVNASPYCIFVNFSKILQEDANICTKEQQCVVNVYSIVNGSTLANYIIASTKDIVIKVPKDTSLSIVIGGKPLINLQHNSENRVILVRVIFFRSTSYWNPA